MYVKYLSRPQPWDDEWDRKWDSPPLSERIKHSIISLGFHGYYCGYCGYAYFTIKGLENCGGPNGCCAQMKKAGIKEDRFLQMYGRTSIMPTSAGMRRGSMGYPGQFDNCSSRYNNSMTPMDGHRH